MEPKTCFVCKKKLENDPYKINKELNLPVCKTCRGSDEEKKEAEELLDSLADDLICGCI
ncbi:MAG: hypothetical protein JW833_11105 [Prolixibacteraceae bacterium]|nr:hypothetical protein [Prolixibacteraceae bacterium]